MSNTSTSSNGSSSSTSEGSTSRLYAMHDQWHVTSVATATGTVVERYAYEAFGTSFVLSPSFALQSVSLFDWETRFGSYRLDDETLLYCVRFRSLHPRLGRWVSRDPASDRHFVATFESLVTETASLIEREGAFYNYLSNRPGISADPLGLERKFPGCREDQKQEIEKSLAKFCKKLQDPESPELACCVDGMNLADPIRKIIARLKETCVSPNRSFRCAPDEDPLCADQKGPEGISITGGYTGMRPNEIALCPSAFNKARYSDVGCVIIHELTHASGARDEALPYKVQNCFEGCEGGRPGAPR